MEDSKRTRARSSQAGGTSPTAPAPFTEDDIARRAYDLFVERGCEPGRDLDDWLRAESELTASARQIDAGSQER
jgi:hypothetical protein